MKTKKKSKRLTEREAVDLACSVPSNEPLYGDAREFFAEQEDALPLGVSWRDVEAVAVQLCMEMAGL